MRDVIPVLQIQIHIQLGMLRTSALTWRHCWHKGKKTMSLRGLARTAYHQGASGQVVCKIAASPIPNQIMIACLLM